MLLGVGAGVGRRGRARRAVPRHVARQHGARHLAERRRLARHPARGRRAARARRSRPLRLLGVACAAGAAAAASGASADERRASGAGPRWHSRPSASGPGTCSSTPPRAPAIRCGRSSSAARRRPRSRRSRPSVASIASRFPLRIVVAAGLFDVGGNALYVVARDPIPIGLAAALIGLYPVVTMILARVVLGERLPRLGQLGVALALLGIVLISAGG